MQLAPVITSLLHVRLEWRRGGVEDCPSYRSLTHVSPPLACPDFSTCTANSPALRTHHSLMLAKAFQDVGKFAPLLAEAFLHTPSHIIMQHILAGISFVDHGLNLRMYPNLISLTSSICPELPLDALNTNGFKKFNCNAGRHILQTRQGNQSCYKWRCKVVTAIKHLQRDIRWVSHLWRWQAEWSRSRKVWDSKYKSSWEWWQTESIRHIYASKSQSHQVPAPALLTFTGVCGYRCRL